MNAGADWVWRGRRVALGWLRQPRQTLLIEAFTAEAHVIPTHHDSESMPIASLKEALGLVARSDEAAFIGRRESEFLDAKGRIGWDLSTLEARYELAKDVSSFANAKGGVIIVGFGTTAVPNADTDEISSADLMPESEFPVSAIKGSLKDYLFPSIRGLRAFWAPSVHDQTIGFGVIEIPAQPEETLPVLIARVVESGSQVKQIVAGFARRAGSSSVPLSPSELQRSFREGMHPTTGRLIRIEEKIDQLLSRDLPQPALAASDAQTDELLRARLKSILEAE